VALVVEALEQVLQVQMMLHQEHLALVAVAEAELLLIQEPQAVTV
jgi:hypothetical protein